MVLGLRSKNKNRTSFKVDYLIHVQEIKPWPPSQSLRSVKSVLLQWSDSDQSSGSLVCNVGDGKIEFNESFRLSITLHQEASRRSSSVNIQKHCLEFNLYETAKKSVKGQLLGTAVRNLSEYGIIKENIFINAPINLKKSSRHTMQPVIYLIIEPFYKENSSSSSPKSSLSKEVSLEKESFSEMTNEGNDKECEIASFTDDDEDDDNDRSSRSSQMAFSSAIGSIRSSPAKNDKNGLEPAKNGYTKVNPEHIPLSFANAQQEVNLDVATPVHESLDSLSSSNLTANLGNSATDPPTKLASQVGIVRDQVFNNSSTETEDENKKSQRDERSGLADATIIKENGKDKQTFEVNTSSMEDELVSNLSDISIKEGKHIQLKCNLKDKESVPLHFDSDKRSGQLINSWSTEKEEEDDTYKSDTNVDVSNLPGRGKETVNNSPESIADVDSRIEMLEDELREAASLEIGLYSVVAEHGSSMNKVHAPARRLSRFYLHACNAGSAAKRASAARAAISGLILVSKACGNDVPRLTFWLSNSLVLRAIVSQAIAKLQLSTINDSDQGGAAEETFVSSRHENSSNIEEKSNLIETSDAWEDTQTFIGGLEKFEAWTFSRIIESIWWQTLTPHMQSAAAKGSSHRKPSGKRYGLSDQEQGNFSIELWQKAFKDACERLCPIRAGGHECGCLPVLAKLVMEQLVCRLDVAMFNAILRESPEDMPTDPVSDPICDSKVLPVPAGKSSFGAGVQLKNAIGSWSRWLTDLFGIDDNDYPEDMNEVSDNKSLENEKSFKVFNLLNALSDLMMLPSEMLRDASTRKEVCPTFGSPIIKRVLINFVPDEFNPDPIPDTIFEALDSEELGEVEESSLMSFPCSASPTTYSPPPPASLIGIIGDIGNQTLERSGSVVLRKSYTSDDELDELDSPMTSIIVDNRSVSSTSLASNWMSKGNRGRKVARYQLLRQVWRASKW